MQRIQAACLALLFFSLITRCEAQIVSPARQLAQELVAAKSDAERTALLARHPEVALPDLAQQLIVISEDSRVKVDYAVAETAADLSLQIAQQASSEPVTARALFQIGLVRYIHEDYDGAREEFQKSLDIRQRIPEQPDVAYTINFIGTCYRQQGKFTEAATYFDKSLLLSQSAGKERDRAAVLNSLCLMHQDQTQYDKAEEECGESLRLRRQLANNADIGESLLAMGRLKYFEENYDAAITHYTESLKLFEQLGHMYRLSFLTSGLGDAYLLEGRYASALESYEKSMKISESVGSLRNLGWVLLRIGEIHDTQSNYDLAMEYARKSLETFQKIQIYKVYPARAQALIGRIYLHEGKMDDAMQWYERAIADFEQIDSKIDIAFHYNELGRAQFLHGNLKAAAADYSKSLHAAEAIDSKYSLSLVLNNMGHLAVAQERYQEALEHSKRAAGYAAEAGTHNILFESLLVMGQAYAGMGDAAKARQSLDQSIAVVEDLRSEVAGGEEDRERFLAGRIQPYHAMIDLLLTQKDVAGALSYAERAKARVLLDSLSGSKTDPRQFMTREEKAAEQDQLKRMAALNVQTLEESRKNQPDPAALQGLQHSLQSLRDQHEALYTALYSSHPELRLQRGKVQTTAITEAGKRLLDSRTVLLEYVATESNTYVFVVNGKMPGIQALPIGLERTKLAAKIEEFRNSLAALNLDFMTASKELYRFLIGPVESLIAGKENIVIVPDGELWNLPFSALRSPTNRYLLEDHTLVETPSLATLEQTMIAQNDAHEGPKMLLAMGNPSIAAGSETKMKSLFRGAELGPLPDAEREVKSLAAIYGSSHSTIYVGKDASEDRFKTEANQYRVLHIATHGLLNDQSPLYSELVLAPGSTPGSEDGLLEAWEIMNLNLNHNHLAVLSACETGRGKIGSGEGIIGLSWAFLLAGIRTTVVSQWKVESKNTTDLMVRFHQQLAAQKSPAKFQSAEALRAAALQILKRPASSHPFYWAGFVVIGPS